MLGGWCREGRPELGTGVDDDNIRELLGCRRPVYESWCGEGDLFMGDRCLER